MPRPRPALPLVSLLVLLAVVLAACGGGSDTPKKAAAAAPKVVAVDETTTTTSTTAASAGDSSTTTAAAPVASTSTTVAIKGAAAKVAKPAAKPQPVTVRLGYFPNVTHAIPIIGVEGGIYQDSLGDDPLHVSTFNAGPAAIEALFSGAIDATYVGPNPAINGFVQSHGEALRIVSGSTSGGAALVVRPSINAPADLKGKKLATPQLGNTQDVALRSWLKQNGLSSDTNGGGDVSIVPQDNGQTLDAFKQNQIDGAWLPEPWVSRLVQEAGAKVLVNEKDLWPDGRFVTTHLVVATKFLNDHPDAIARLLEGELRATAYAADHPAEAQALVNQGITKITGKGLAPAIIQAAWANLEFTLDPVPSSLKTSAEHAEDVGLLDHVDLSGIYDLRLLDSLLRYLGVPEVQGF